MSFTAKQYEDVFDMAEFVYISNPTLLKVREDAQKMMLAVEEVVGQMRRGDDRARLGLGGKPGELLK